MLHVRLQFGFPALVLLVLLVFLFQPSNEISASCRPSLCCFKPCIPIFCRDSRYCQPFIVESRQPCVYEFQFQTRCSRCDIKKRCMHCYCCYTIPCNRCGDCCPDICPNCGYCCPYDSMPEPYDYGDDDDGACCCRKSGRDALGILNPYDPIIDLYTISIGDLLEISIFGDEDTIVDEVVIAPDGFLYYFFLNPIYAEGKTLKELREQIVAQLKDYFLAPEVSIIPKGMSNQSYTILGKVRIPGLYPLTQSMTLRQAIGAAGGIFTEQDVSDTDFGTGGNGFYVEAYGNRIGVAANLRKSFVVRDGKKLDINFETLLYSADTSQDLALKPGDYVYIASNEHRDIYVLGTAFAPGVLQYYDGMSLMGALTAAGGWTRGPYGTDKQRILIVRGSLKCPEVMVVDLCCILSGKARDVYLKPGDIIYVSEKKFGYLRELVRIAIEAFVISFTNLAGVYYADQIVD